jgi:hypothetical protein
LQEKERLDIDIDDLEGFPEIYQLSMMYNLSRALAIPRM